MAVHDTQSHYVLLYTDTNGFPEGNLIVRNIHTKFYLRACIHFELSAKFMNIYVVQIFTINYFNPC